MGQEYVGFLFPTFDFSQVFLKKYFLFVVKEFWANVTNRSHLEKFVES